MTTFFFLIDTLLTIAIMSFVCHGIALLFWDEMVFESVGKWYQKRLDAIERYKNSVNEANQNSTAGFIPGVNTLPTEPPISYYVIKSLFKPIVGCVVCFASFWGTVTFFALEFAQHEFILLTVGLVFKWIICCVATVFVNYKLNK